LLGNIQDQCSLSWFVQPLELQAYETLIFLILILILILILVLILIFIRILKFILVLILIRILMLIIVLILVLILLNLDSIIYLQATLLLSTTPGTVNVIISLSLSVLPSSTQSTASEVCN